MIVLKVKISPPQNSILGKKRGVPHIRQKINQLGFGSNFQGAYERMQLGMKNFTPPPSAKSQF